jgi:hypothetical protein
MALGKKLFKGTGAAVLTPIAIYEMENNVNDTNNNYNLTAYGSVSYPSSFKAVGNYSLNINALGEKASSGYLNHFGLTLDQNKSISLFAYFSQPTDTSGKIAILQNKISIVCQNVGGTIRIQATKWVTGQSMTIGNGIVYRKTTTATFSTGTWYHIAVVQTGTGDTDFDLYVNGSLASVTQNSTGYGGYADEGFIVGSGPVYAGTQYWQYYGLIDHVKVFDDALQASQISDLANE